MASARQYSIKVVVIGESGVGKSSISARYVHSTFSDCLPSSIASAYLEAERQVEDVDVKFLIWDTAGQERFQAITPLYYRGAQAAIIVYDITSEDSFCRVRRWYNQLTRSAPSVKMIVVCGNKIDLEDQRKVSTERGLTLAEDLKLTFHETSAFHGTNVDTMFTDIVCALFERQRRPSVTSLPSEVIDLQKSKKPVIFKPKKCW